MLTLLIAFNNKDHVKNKTLVQGYNPKQTFEENRSTKKKNKTKAQQKKHLTREFGSFFVNLRPLCTNFSTCNGNELLRL